MSPTYGHVSKLVIESEFQHKGNKQTKKTRILSKILRFSWQKQIQIIKLFKYYTEKDNNKVWPQLPLLGQEPIFNPLYTDYSTCYMMDESICHFSGVGSVYFVFDGKSC